MFCLYCGNKLPDSAVFCNQCGKKQKPAVSTPVSSGITQPGSPISRTTPLVQGLSSPLNATPTTRETPLVHSASLRENISDQSTESTPPAYLSMRNLGSIIAGIAGIVALLAFFSLPYLSIPFGIFGTLSFTGQQLAGYGAQDANSVLSGRFQALQLLWLEPVVAAIILGVAIYVIFKTTQADFNELTAKRAAISLISLAAITLVVLFIRYAIDARPPSGSSYAYSGPTIASFYSSGFWVYVLCMVAVIVGGVVQLRSSQ